MLILLLFLFVVNRIAFDLVSLNWILFSFAHFSILEFTYISDSDEVLPVLLFARSSANSNPDTIWTNLV